MLKRSRKRYEEAAMVASARADRDMPVSRERQGLVEAETEVERTHKLAQRTITSEVARSAASNAWTLRLDRGPYGVRCSRNGRLAVCFGLNGAVNVIDLLTLKKTETVKESRNERLKDATFLQDETMVAVAQEKYVYIYDSRGGAEIHRLAGHLEPLFLQFLKYHMLLASIGNSGTLKYLDVSMGLAISDHKISAQARSVDQNPQTGALLLGQHNGVVSFWAPKQSKALAKVLCHRGPVSAVATNGNTFVTAGVDSTIKLWDVRTFRCIETVKRNRATLALALSQRNLLAVIAASGVDVFDIDSTKFDEETPLKKKKKKMMSPRSPYLSHRFSFNSTLGAVFRPFEDVLLVGHASGVQSLVIPGSGELLYDSLEGQSPYQKKEARRNTLVRGLLDKLPPETIDLQGPDFVGLVAKDPKIIQEEKRQLLQVANAKDPSKKDDDPQKAAANKKKKNKLKKKSKKIQALAASSSSGKGNKKGKKIDDKVDLKPLDRLFAS